MSAESGALIADLQSRLACVVDVTYWDRPYDTRMAAIRELCDLGDTPRLHPQTSGPESAPDAGTLVYEPSISGPELPSTEGGAA